jgi:hypothetical protein
MPVVRTAARTPGFTLTAHKFGLVWLAAARGHFVVGNGKDPPPRSPSSSAGCCGFLNYTAIDYSAELAALKTVTYIQRSCRIRTREMVSLMCVL